MKSSLSVIGMLALTAGTQAGSQNLVVNGGFEEGSPLPPCNWTAYFAPSEAVPGWTVHTGSIDHIQTSGAPCSNMDVLAAEGQRFLDLDGVTQAGEIQQSIPTLVGARYLLEFKMSGTNYCGLLLKQLRVDIAGQSQVFKYRSVNPGPQTWVSHAMEFTATSNSQLLTILSLDGSGCGPKIDDVRITELFPCPGDVIQNGVVDGSDLAAVLTVWGTNGGIYPRADTNGDGAVDGTDLATVLAGWGACP